MATRKMTFSLPTALAAQFIKRVSARERSRYVAEALAARLRERDKMLARAAEVANRSRQVGAIEREFDRLDPESTWASNHSADLRF
jgi:ubiquinone biosynthesis protein UbiJ